MNTNINLMRREVGINSHPCKGSRTVPPFVGANKGIKKGYVIINPKEFQKIKNVVLEATIDDQPSTIRRDSPTRASIQAISLNNFAHLTNESKSAYFCINDTMESGTSKTLS